MVKETHTRILYTLDYFHDMYARMKMEQDNKYPLIT